MGPWGTVLTAADRAWEHGFLWGAASSMALILLIWAGVKWPRTAISLSVGIIAIALYIGSK